MSAQVELIYDLDCPNVQEARKALLQGFAEAGIPASWTEWNRKSLESPEYARHYGSPTILVNGRDVAGAEPVEGADCCRVYQYDADGLRRVPTVSSLVAALQKNLASAPEAKMKKASAWHSVTSLPSVGAALLPAGGCPACWPVYSGVLGSLGLTFLLDSTYLLWINSALMGVALLALGFRAKARRGYGPLILGAASAGVILFFKFARVLDPLVNAGLSGLVIASLWNAWPKRNAGNGPCPRCAQTKLLKHSTNES